MQDPKRIVDEADAFLLRIVEEHLLASPAEPGEAREVLERYLTPRARPATLAGRDGVYRRLAQVAQDYGMAPTVIGRSVGGVENLASVLGEFDPGRVCADYPHVDAWGALLDRVVAELGPKGQVRREPRSLWPRYCRTLIAGARFLAEFESTDRFYAWVDELEREPERRLELPRRVERDVSGLGFALACLFFMELGYASFLKPDVWVIRFCNRMAIADGGDPERIFAACANVADRAGRTPFALDRMIWLICTGNFWLDGVTVGTRLDAFEALVGRRGC